VEDDGTAAEARAKEAAQGVLLTVTSEAEKALRRKQLVSLFEIDGRDSGGDLTTNPSSVNDADTPPRSKKSLLFRQA
jgi:uncharacterized protein (DUF1778 family)